MGIGAPNPHTSDQQGRAVDVRPDVTDAIVIMIPNIATGKITTTRRASRSAARMAASTELIACIRSVSRSGSAVVDVGLPTL